jgi:uncharacterized OB-fold protein
MPGLNTSPLRSLDAQPYWDGLQAGQLLIQCCRVCGHYRHYPRPMCPTCQAMDHDWLPVSDVGTVHSWTVLHQSALPELAGLLPLTLLTVALPEGVRLLGRLRPGADTAVVDGAAVHISVVVDAAGDPQVQFDWA